MSAEVRVVWSVAAQLLAILHGMGKNLGDAGRQGWQLLEEHVAGRPRPGLDESVVRDHPALGCPLRGVETSQPQPLGLRRRDHPHRQAIFHGEIEIDVE